MEYVSLGHMERAPLVYSLAMIEFAPVPGMDDFAEDIMEALRSTYPDISEFNTPNLTVQVDANSGETKAEQRMLTQWRLNNADGNFGIVFGKERLVFHTTIYKSFALFAESMRPVIQTVFDIANIKYVKNIGIRHIDNIFPMEGKAIKDLLKPGYLCPEQGESLVPEFSRVEFVYKSKIGYLYLRSYELRDHPRVPQDLFPAASQLSQDYKLMEPIKENFVLLDTDHIYTPEKLQEANIDKIIDTLDELHKQNSLGFRSMVEENAIELWRNGA
ncbi:MAG: TIGR04255 family protein [Methylophaga sp.]|uniref:TIGR04255 family protein n=1 Tax=Methylophaga sp. TaxID=2024840 RepID=UPI00217092CE|nr:TIGR04255 family protein [Methylophaga sp.]MBL1458855.1 TIGR04255 family protein [Methylophaga sp.]